VSDGAFKPPLSDLPRVETFLYRSPMQAPSTLAPDETFDEIEEKLSHTWILLLACQLTPSIAPPFAKLLADLEALRPVQTKLDREVATQDARVWFGDDELNVLLDETKKEVLVEIGNEYGAPLYTQLFGNQAPSELRRFLMGEQLTAMRTWPAILAQTSNAKLHKIGSRITLAVQQADQILAALASAKAAQSAFALGPRAAFVQACNAARGAAFGKLLEMAKDPASGPLPDDFVDRFFRRDTSGRAPRLEDLEKAVTRAADRLAKVTAQRDEVAARQAKALQTKQGAELAVKQAALTAKKKAADEAAAEVAALEAEMAKGKAT
jgi:hypothetical protein